MSESWSLISRWSFSGVMLAFNLFANSSWKLLLFDSLERWRSLFWSELIEAIDWFLSAAISASFFNFNCFSNNEACCLSCWNLASISDFFLAIAFFLIWVSLSGTFSGFIRLVVKFWKRKFSHSPFGSKVAKMHGDFKIDFLSKNFWAMEQRWEDLKTILARPVGTGAAGGE